VKLFGKDSPLRAKGSGMKKAYPKTKRAARETAKELARSQAAIAASADKLAKTVAKRTSKTAVRARRTAGACGAMAVRASHAVVAAGALRRGDANPRATMKILFFGRRFTYFRNFDTVLRELARRGHVIHLAVERETDEGRALIDGLIAEFPQSITVGTAPERTPDEWAWIVARLRHGLEYLRYQHRLFDDTPKLRDRSRERTPGLFVKLGDAVGRYARWSRRPIEAVLRWLERSTPDDPVLQAYIDEHKPDLVLITPLIGLGSSQIDYLRAARCLGIPTALCVWSWDHLSSKALIRELPDRVFVWNDTQRREAQTLHRVPSSQIVVTGAQCFDKWFDRQPSRDRGTFCRLSVCPRSGRSCSTCARRRSAAASPRHRSSSTGFAVSARTPRAGCATRRS
jgi:hypothetical protein